MHIPLCLHSAPSLSYAIMVCFPEARSSLFSCGQTSRYLSHCLHLPRSHSTSQCGTSASVGRKGSCCLHMYLLDSERKPFPLLSAALNDLTILLGPVTRGPWRMPLFGAVFADKKPSSAQMCTLYQKIDSPLPSKETPLASHV